MLSITTASRGFWWDRTCTIHLPWRAFLSRPFSNFRIIMSTWKPPASSLTCWAQQKRKIIIDQDAGGPAGTDQQSMLLLIQSPQTDVLGITVVTGDQWLNAEVAHTLRMLELIGRTDIPVFRGAEYPL